MKVRIGLATLIALIAIALLYVVGCAGAENEPAEPTAAGGMGMETAAGGDASEDDPAMGLIASERFTDLQAPTVSRNSDGIVVRSCLAPADGWLVARSTLPSGTVLGYAPVTKGENRNVLVPLAAADAVNVRIALHGDKGERGTFEFDPQLAARSFDRPVFVDGVAVSSPVRLSGYGMEARSHEISLMVTDQAASDTLRVGQALVPEPAWLVVTSEKSGEPSRILAFMGVDGESMELDVRLRDKGLTDRVRVTLVADLGEKGAFGYAPGDPLGSEDQPYTFAGKVMSQVVNLD